MERYSGTLKEFLGPYTSLLGFKSLALGLNVRGFWLGAEGLGVFGICDA